MIISIYIAGFLAVRHYEFMLGRTMKDLYCDFLKDLDASVLLRCQVKISWILIAILTKLTFELMKIITDGGF